MDPHIAQSGNISGNHLSISKRGNKYLRCLLYMAVTCSLPGNKENLINTFYKKKKQQRNPL
ncbi:transposase, partial [Floccifex porci]|uniref:transposase n=1 Tax=Floccifex porci TaxID=2606629 RepID=UPI003C6D4E2B